MIFPLTLKSKELNRKERILSAFDPRSAGGGTHKAPGVADFNHSAISGHKHSFFSPTPVYTLQEFLLSRSLFVLLFKCCSFFVFSNKICPASLLADLAGSIDCVDRSVCATDGCNHETGCSHNRATNLHLARAAHAPTLALATAASLLMPAFVYTVHVVRWHELRWL